MLISLLVVALVILIGTSIFHIMEKPEYDRLVSERRDLEQSLSGVDMGLVNDYCERKAYSDNPWSLYHSVIFATHILSVGTTRPIILQSTRLMFVMYIILFGPLVLASCYMVSIYFQSWFYWVYCEIRQIPYVSPLDMKRFLLFRLHCAYWFFWLCICSIHWYFKNGRKAFDAFYDVFMFVTMIDSRAESYQYCSFDMCFMCFAFFNTVGTYIGVLDFLVHSLEHDVFVKCAYYAFNKDLTRDSEYVDENLKLASNHLNSMNLKKHMMQRKSSQKQERKASQRKSSRSKMMEYTNTLKSLHLKYKTGEIKNSIIPVQRNARAPIN